MLFNSERLVAGTVVNRRPSIPFSIEDIGIRYDSKSDMIQLYNREKNTWNDWGKPRSIYRGERKEYNVMITTTTLSGNGSLQMYDVETMSLVAGTTYFSDEGAYFVAPYTGDYVVKYMGTTVDGLTPATAGTKITITGEEAITVVQLENGMTSNDPIYLIRDGIVQDGLSIEPVSSMDKFIESLEDGTLKFTPVPNVTGYSAIVASLETSFRDTYECGFYEGRRVVLEGKFDYGSIYILNGQSIADQHYFSQGQITDTSATVTGHTVETNLTIPLNRTESVGLANRIDIGFAVNPSYTEDNDICIKNIYLL